jgi:hypothetical protein
MKLKRIAGVVVGVAALSCCVGKPAKGAEAFDSFISPVSSFTNFEDPRSTTELRPIFMFHQLSDTFSVGDGGEAYLLALQARVAITDRFSFIATKDGILWLQPNQEIEGALEQESGLANLAFGLKYAIVHDAEANRIVTLGMRYEAPSGSSRVLQGKVFQIEGFDERGAGLLNPFISAGAMIEDFHVLGYAGFRAALDDVDSSFFDMSLHLDRPFGNFVPLIEVNWVQTIDEGGRLPLGGEGFDVINLGSTNSDGTGVVTSAVGARYRLAQLDLCDIDLGAAVEFPLTDREDIFNFRLTTDMIFRFNWSVN